MSRLFKKLVLGISAIVVVFGISSALIGCSDSVGSNQSGANDAQAEDQEATSGPEDLIIEDSGYIISNGFVDYGIEITNPNEAEAAQFANITVSCTKPDGTEAYNNDIVVTNIMPGSTTYWAGVVGDGQTTEEDEISIQVSVSEGCWVQTDVKRPEELYAFENVEVLADENDQLQVSGDITLFEDFEVFNTPSTTPLIICILKDADGNIITGIEGYIGQTLTVDELTPFSFGSDFSKVDYATYEIYANPWL